MFKLIYTSLVLLLVIWFTGSPLRAEEPVSFDRFDGFYLGAQAGVGSAAAKFTIANIPIFDSDATGTAVGLYGGYGWQRGRRYLGVELAAGYSGVKNGNLLPVVATPWLTGEIERVYAVSLLGKVGRVVGEERKTLVYGLIGPSVVRIEANATLTGLGAVSDGTPYPGLSVGVGVDHFFSDRFSARAQGVFTKYWEVDDVYNGVAIQEYDLDTVVIQFG
ncbi:outer membrane protein, partial [Pseudohalocynthiibacter aestuariivivens]